MDWTFPVTNMMDYATPLLAGSTIHSRNFRVLIEVVYNGSLATVNDKDKKEKNHI